MSIKTDGNASVKWADVTVTPDTKNNEELKNQERPGLVRRASKSALGKIGLTDTKENNTSKIQAKVDKSDIGPNLDGNKTESFVDDVKSKKLFSKKPALTRTRSQSDVSKRVTIKEPDTHLNAEFENGNMNASKLEKQMKEMLPTAVKVDKAVAIVNMKVTKANEDSAKLLNDVAMGTKNSSSELVELSKTCIALASSKGDLMSEEQLNQLRTNAHTLAEKGATIQFLKGKPQSGFEIRTSFLKELGPPTLSKDPALEKIFVNASKSIFGSYASGRSSATVDGGNINVDHRIMRSENGQESKVLAVKLTTNYHVRDNIDRSLNSDPNVLINSLKKAFPELKNSNITVSTDHHVFRDCIDREKNMYNVGKVTEGTVENYIFQKEVKAISDAGMVLGKTWTLEIEGKGKISIPITPEYDEKTGQYKDNKYTELVPNVGVNNKTTDVTKMRAPCNTSIMQDVNLEINRDLSVEDQLKFSHILLTMVGTGPVFEKDGESIKEKTKILTAFHAFFPGEALKLKLDENVFNLSTSELMNKIDKFLTEEPKKIQAEIFKNMDDKNAAEEDILLVKNLKINTAEFNDLKEELNKLNANLNALNLELNVSNEINQLNGEIKGLEENINVDDITAKIVDCKNRIDKSNEKMVIVKENIRVCKKSLNEINSNLRYRQNANLDFMIAKDGFRNAVRDNLVKEYTTFDGRKALEVSNRSDIVIKSCDFAKNPIWGFYAGVGKDGKDHFRLSDFNISLASIILKNAYTSSITRLNTGVLLEGDSPGADAAAGSLDGVCIRAANESSATQSSNAAILSGKFKFIIRKKVIDRHPEMVSYNKDLFASKDPRNITRLNEGQNHVLNQLPVTSSFSNLNDADIVDNEVLLTKLIDPSDLVGILVNLTPEAYSETGERLLDANGGFLIETDKEKMIRGLIDGGVVKDGHIGGIPVENYVMEGLRFSEEMWGKNEKLREVYEANNK